MTNPGGTQIDPQLVARLSGEFAALGQHLRGVSEDLTRLRVQLEVPARPASPTVAAPPQQHVPYVPMPPVPVPPVPMPTIHAAQPAFAQPAYQVGHAPQVPPRPAPVAQPRREPWWQRDDLVSRVLAAAGAAVTLIGVVMLLVLAAQAGFFGPVARVVSGAVLSAALVTAGVRVYDRSGGRVGAIALTVTGLAGGFLSAAAATTYYGWLPPLLGLALAAAIAATGMLLATRWESQPLAALVITAIAILAPVLTGGVTVTLLAFLVMLQIAGAYPQLGRDWPYLHVARTLPAVVAMLVVLADAAWSGIGLWPDGFRPAVALLLAAAATVAVVGAGSAVLVVRRNADDVTSSAMLATSSLPLLFTGTVLTRWVEVAVLVATAVGLVTLLVAVPDLPRHTRVAASAVAALAALQASVVGTPGDTLPLTLLVLALGLVAISHRTGSRIAFTVATGFGLLGGPMFLSIASPEALTDPDATSTSLVVIVAGTLVAGAAVAFLLTARTLGLLTADNTAAATIIAGVVAGYAVTATVVTAGVAALGPATGFVAGHTVATLLWMALATAVLRWGLTHPEHARLALAAGLTLTGAALAKLFLFDLATLDGGYRVLAFLGVGLLLLAVGTRYARAFASGGRGGSAPA
ncbi:DUF2339 domain-containing protein [Rhodococcus triatomae]|nr:hypothetical protein G419_20025 [Rhodococcus triatomae BKS 15-14]